MVSAEAPIFEAYGNWSPSNHNDNYQGYYSMRGAMAQSVNTVSAKYISDCGIENAVDLARRAGFGGKIPAVPSLSLGTAEVTLMELTAAYGSFINNGVVVTPKYLLKIEDIDGNVLFEDKNIAETRKAINPETALIVNHLLEGVVNEGTANSIRGKIDHSYHLAGKTGTTQKNIDNWFVGYSPGLITGVWVGLENPAFANAYPLPFGASGSAVHIWADYYDEIRRDSRTRKYMQGTFEPLTYELLEMLDCPSFLEEVPEPSLLEQIFGTDKDYYQKREEPKEKRKGLLRRLFDKIF
jgi:penicillin-binding protein 1A